MVRAVLCCAAGLMALVSLAVAFEYYLAHQLAMAQIERAAELGVCVRVR